MRGKWIFQWVVVGILFLQVGCIRDNRMDVSDREINLNDFEIPADVVGTVGQFARPTGEGGMPVVGYGVVVNLGTHGSREVPQHLRSYLVDVMRREGGVGMASHGLEHLSPSRILEDISTAVVVVRGVIPARTLEGERFDLEVVAHSATGTQSLEGGYLMPTELRLDRGANSPAGAGSRVYGHARGTVLINPFLDTTAPENALELRHGRIVGGGQAEQARTIRLSMLEANYPVANQIKNAINSRFGLGGMTVATARNSASDIHLEVPPAYWDDPAHFVDLVLHLPVDARSGVWQRQAERITEQLAQPDMPHDGLSLVLEAMGPKVRTYLTPLYDSEIASARYFAARAGIRFGDADAARVIEAFAAQPGPYQIAALEELGHHPEVSSGDLVLQRQLDSEDTLVRLAAYRGLLNRGSRAVISIPVDNGKFHVDVINSPRYCTQRPMIFATQTRDPRIVLFGTDIPVRRPVHYTSPDGILTVDGGSDDATLTVWRYIPRSGDYSETFEIDFNAESLILTLGERAREDMYGRSHGLSFTYGQILNTLYRMCESGKIEADFELQLAPEIQTAIGGMPVFDAVEELHEPAPQDPEEIDAMEAMERAYMESP
jgi:hypothetical protein